MSKTKDVQDDDVTEQRRALIEEKLQRAEMKRVSLLQEKIKKAQEEEAKVNNITPMAMSFHWYYHTAQWDSIYQYTGSPE